jgi:antitoxin (DNA-binding transcriptional repressor) of toxin-antitoxin stability system
MKEVALSEVKDDLSHYLRLAQNQEIAITRHGKAAGILIGFESEDDWFDYRLENDPCFLKRIAEARGSLRAGRGVRLEDLVEKHEAERAAAGDIGGLGIRTALTPATVGWGSPPHLSRNVARHRR